MRGKRILISVVCLLLIVATGSVVLGAVDFAGTPGGLFSTTGDRSWERALANVESRIQSSNRAIASHEKDAAEIADKNSCYLNAEKFQEILAELVELQTPKAKIRMEVVELHRRLDVAAVDWLTTVRSKSTSTGPFSGYAEVNSIDDDALALSKLTAILNVALGHRANYSKEWFMKLAEVIALRRAVDSGLLVVNRINDYISDTEKALQLASEGIIDMEVVRARIARESKELAALQKVYAEFKMAATKYEVGAASQ